MCIEVVKQMCFGKNKKVGTPLDCNLVDDEECIDELNWTY